MFMYTTQNKPLTQPNELLGNEWMKSTNLHIVTLLILFEFGFAFINTHQTRAPGSRELRG